nr:hypothetical protein [Tanacetum cinerariifolium]
MTTSTFAKTHNLIAYLAKPAESEGFKQIIDFLNGSSVRYTLTVSPTIRASCIKQFWSTTEVKTVNDEVRVQALIDANRCSAKSTSLNEFSSTMTSAIICLATNQKLNFSRYILLSLVKNIEAGVPFYMFLRFVQLIVDHQLGDMSHHQDIYGNPSLTKKVFANMKRVGTGFSRVLTPLFKSMLVQAVEEVGEAQYDVSIPTKPSTSKPHKKQKSKKQQPIAPKVPSPEPSPEHPLPSPSNEPIPTAKDNLKFQELINLCTRLSNKVMDLESEVIDLKSYFTYKIVKLEDRGRMIADMDEDIKDNLEEAQAKAYNLDLQHSKKVLSMQDTDEEEPAEVEEVLEVVIVAKLMTEVVTTAQPTTTTTIVQVPKASAPRRRMGVVIKTLRRQHQLLSKKQRMDEKAEELKRHLQIVANDDDDVYTKATPLASNLVKERFETTEPKNFSDDFLLNIIKIMFEKPNVEASVWKDQKGRYGLAKVKSWKLFESCGVYVITLTTTQIFLLVEKKYPLTHFTLQQMLDNVRLEVEEESEMSLELL